VISSTVIEPMTTFYGRQPMPSSNALLRKPQRVTITLNWALRQRLQSRADEEGRSLSNLLAHLLETAESA
jgi:macrodomain Ter protein organizer (MatP/YcbG family)